MPSLASVLRTVPARREHGGIVDAELERLGIDPTHVLDLSVSVNPYGPAPGVRAALREAAFDRYPDPEATRARRALAAATGAGVERIVLGNGASELLWTLAHLLLAPGERALVCEPAFSELRAAAEARGAGVVEWRAGPDDDFALDLGEIVRRAREEAVRLVYLCVPGNPSGAVVPAHAVAEAAAGLPDVAILLDQSFLALSTRAGDASHEMPANVIAVRSLTKEHAIPGARVGYLVASREIAAAVVASRPAWTVGAAAQAAAIAACGVPEFVAACRERLLREREDLAAALRATGFAPVPSQTTFFVVPVGDAEAFRRRLLERHGILVRDLSSFGLPGHVRVAACPPDAVGRVVAAFRGEADGAAGSGPRGTAS